MEEREQPKHAGTTAIVPTAGPTGIMPELSGYADHLDTRIQELHAALASLDSPPILALYSVGRDPKADIRAWTDKTLLAKRSTLKAMEILSKNPDLVELFDSLSVVRRHNEVRKHAAEPGSGYTEPTFNFIPAL